MEVVLGAILIVAVLSILFVEEQRIDRLKIKYEIAERTRRFKV